MVVLVVDIREAVVDFIQEVVVGAVSTQEEDKAIIQAEDSVEVVQDLVEVVQDSVVDSEGVQDLEEEVKVRLQLLLQPLEVEGVSWHFQDLVVGIC